MAEILSVKINNKLGNWIVFTLGFGAFFGLMRIFQLADLLPSAPFIPVI